MTNITGTILIVDDEIQNCKLLEMLLRPEGYITQCAANGKEALASIAQHAPDLILLDIMMPGMDGYEVARILKADPATAPIPIIMVTARDDRSARIAGLNAGAEEFLTKPVDQSELWLRVRNLLRVKAFGDFLQNHNLILEQQVRERTADLQRFRAAMDATVEAIMLVNRSSMLFVEVNATACTMLGYTREELLQLGPSQLGAAAHGQLEEVYDAVIAGRGGNESTETQLRRKDGSRVQVEVHRRALRSGADWIIVGVVSDITERKEMQKRLHHLAHYDALTGLPNRTLFYETLKKTLAQALDKGWMVAVLFIDLDHFKNVNDTLGHAIGDELLGQFSNRLARCVRVRDTVGRLGGDEFAVILVMQDGPQGVTLVADKIREVLRAPFDLNGHEVTLTASIGITVHPEDACDPETLIKYADTAMYRAKQAGRDTYRFFTAQMNTEVLARLDLEMALRRAVENGEFVLHYQPKVQLDSGRVAGLEALLRWQRPGHGLVPPQDFIPALEETGLIVPVGSWVIAEACRQIGLWLRTSIGPLPVSVNVSGRQLIEGELDREVIKALLDNDIPADLLELELTESSLMANTGRTIATLQNLKSRGVQISIDDFGTGYSSLAYLRRFPIDKLKIDIAFIRDVTTNPDDAAIALAIIGMAHSLKLDVIAEGVETSAQQAYLRRHCCDQIQGFLFSPPLAVPELEHMLHAQAHLPTDATVFLDPVKDLQVDGARAMTTGPDMPPGQERRLHARRRDDRGGNFAARRQAIVSGSKISACERVVQICEDDTTLINTLEVYIREGLLAGEAAIIIASRTHLTALDDRLLANGIDVGALRSHNVYISLVAEETLAKFMLNDFPNDALFASVVTDVLALARQNGRKVRVFGELVAILWAQGHSVATARLEYLWNQFCSQQSFSLFCAYPLVGFAENADESMAHVCATHSKVILA